MNAQGRLVVALLVLLAATAGLLTWASASNTPATCGGWFGYTPQTTAPVASGCASR